MGELINGKMPEHIKDGLRCRVTGDAKCSDCAYYGTVLYEIGQREYECDDIDRDALALIERLEAERDAALAKVPKWISVDERLPENGNDVLCWYEYYRYGDYNRMYQTYGIGCYWNGTWCGDVSSGSRAKVLYWMPLPEPPKESV